MSMPLVVVAGPILPSGPSALEAQTRIDGQIAELQQTISDLQARLYALRTQRNALSPISCFPSEILSTIFIRYAQINHGFSKPKRKVPELVNVSYVCRYWREVALNCPDLWSYISVASQRWTEVLLSRSKLAPLRIKLNWRDSRSQSLRLLPILEQSLDHTARIEELELSIPDSDYWTVLAMLSSPAPLLRSLHIAMVDGLDLTSAAPPFFNGVVPALRQIHLSNCRLPQPTSMLGNLTTLILYDRSKPPHILATLFTMQRLVHLELHHVLRMSNGNNAGGLRFPHLLQLAIEDDFHCINEFLPCLDISSQTKVRITAQMLRFSHEDWPPFRSLLGEKFFLSRDFSPSIYALGIRRVSNLLSTFIFHGSYNKSCFWDSLNWGCDIPLQISFDFLHDKEPNVIQEVVQDAYRSGFLSGLRSAHVTVSTRRCYEDRCSPSFWQDTLGVVPELHSIKLIDADESLRYLLSTLSLPRPHDENASDETPFPLMFAPDLEELMIESPLFSSDEQSHGFLPNLLDALGIRKENGYTLSRLTLCKCRNLSKEDVAKLKRVVEEVVWDGAGDECDLGNWPEDSSESGNGNEGSAIVKLGRG